MIEVRIESVDVDNNPDIRDPRGTAEIAVYNDDEEIERFDINYRRHMSQMEILEQVLAGDPGIIRETLEEYVKNGADGSIMVAGEPLLANDVEYVLDNSESL